MADALTAIAFGIVLVCAALFAVEVVTTAIDVVGDWWRGRP